VVQPHRSPTGPATRCAPTPPATRTPTCTPTRPPNAQVGPRGAGSASPRRRTPPGHHLASRSSHQGGNGLVLRDAQQHPDDSGDIVAEPDADYETLDGGSFADSDAGSVIEDDGLVDQIRARGRRIYVDDVEVFKWGEAHYRLEGDGRTMRLITYQQWVRNRVLALDLTPGQLRAEWAQVKSREALVRQLSQADIELAELTTKLENPDVDAVDLPIGVAWGLPLVSREERALRLRREQRTFLASFAPQAREVLDALLSKFVEFGATESSPQTLQVPPISDLGSVTELAARFDGTDGLHTALDELGRRLFDVA
jgi:type I restriction enzyme, R subunit